MYLAIFLGMGNAYAQCILNRYGQELCVGEEALYQESSHNKVELAEIKEIDYNLLTIKVNGKKLKVSGSDLIGKRNCRYYRSPFCETQNVEIKSECQKNEHTFKSVQLFYNDLVLLKQKGLFSSKKAILKTECLVISE